MSAIERIDELLIAVDRALVDAQIPHAFGGAIALAYCTSQPRGTVDLDVNVFVEASQAQQVFEALSEMVSWTRKDLKAAYRDQQVRLWAGSFAVDLFFSYVSFHDVARRRSRKVEFADREIAVLDCTDLAVFKAMFNRTKDWADIEEAIAASSIDIRRLKSWITRLVGREDVRHESLDRAIAIVEQGFELRGKN